MITHKTSNVVQMFEKISVAALVSHIKENKLLHREENFCEFSSLGVNWDFVAADIYVDLGHKVDDTIIDEAFDVLEEDLKNKSANWSNFD